MKPSCTYRYLSTNYTSPIFVTFTSSILSGMKRLLVAGLVIFCIALIAVYVSIPKELEISSIAVIKANERSVYRSLVDKNNWKNWWPLQPIDSRQKETNEFYLDGYSYKIGAKLPDGMEVIINHQDSSNSSLLRLLRLSPDSMLIKWTATVPTTYNPVTRVKQYFAAKRIKRGMEQIVAHLKPFAETTKNMYGIDVKQTRVTDTILMVRKIVPKERPTTTDIYSYIESLRSYIAGSGATETNHPMLHLHYTEETRSYEAMVAIPVSKKLAGTASISPKRMVAGHILYADVKGGEATVAEAMRQMENYASDHEKISPALPYQLLVTDRVKETDTANWVTRIYYPIL